MNQLTYRKLRQGFVVYAYLLPLVFLRDSDAANQGLEALILAQAVEYRLDFEVDHKLGSRSTISWARSRARS